MSRIATQFIQADSIRSMEMGEYDGVADLILTDPLYNYDQETKEYIHSLFLRVIKPNGTIIVFSPPKNQWIKPADQIGFWIKPISTKNTSKRYSRFVEMLFFYQFGNFTWNTERHWSQYTNVFFDLVDERNHPWRKPPSLIKRLILNHTKEWDLVFDPFAGSGVVGDTCLETHRNFICIDYELDKYR